MAPENTAWPTHQPARRNERPLARGVSPRGRRLSGLRRSGRLAHPDPQHDRKAVGGHHPQRHAGSGISGPAGQPAYLRRPHSHAAWPADVCRWPDGGRRLSPRRTAPRSTPRSAQRTAMSPALLDQVGATLSGITRWASVGSGAQSRKPRSAISNLSASARTARWSCWSLPMAMSKTASSPRRPARPRRRCARPRIS